MMILKVRSIRSMLLILILNSLLIVNKVNITIVLMTEVPKLMMIA